ncbi:uncharacterized protein BJ171DRAFT_461933 [Polychytrium aggregatum]|uniref:uncharacterized protein n=1 Tax=Polychytrium aggregatum TaxID=110093 RepID=UPI0022FE75FA|nr:uncharacterized protein BJ171DRAFT_461933 [Polychytrium aggregatum]KAI9201845.1 hypothetical protein BJ171DRAFT_461933 [Polychytrium aggregatum]
MVSQDCGACNKVVYQTEKVEAAGHWYHKGCFKCADAECGISLNLKNFKAANGAVWCEKHLPKPKATTVSDSVSVMHALHAPKKTTEGLHKTQVGTGEAPSFGLDTISTQHALAAPKKPIENIGNIQKGAGQDDPSQAPATKV